MSVVNAIPLIAAGDDGYSLTRSLRFRSSASAYLNRTFTNEQGTYTLSLWVKRGTLGVQQEIANSRTSGAGNTSYIEFNSSDQINIQLNGTSVLTTTAVYRDPASWYQIILSVTASATSYLYVNGTQIGSWTAGANPFLFSNGAGYVCAIGRQGNLSAQYFDGYMAEINYIDGQALSPTAFGAFSIYNQWLPKKYAGTYGTNGFYLPFTNNASAATLGNDFSGNSNTWTTNNISVTAGTTYDSMTDVPTLTSLTAANFAVLNPLSNDSTNTLSNANLTYSIAANGNGYPTSTIQFNANKYYWECTVTSTHNIIGIVLGTTGTTTQLFSTGYGYYAVTGNKYVNGTSSAYGSTYTTGDVIGVAVDMTALTITFYKNNTSQGAISIAAGLYKIAGGNGNSTGGASGSYNFGQRPFTYTPPTGFLALNTFNL